MRFTVRPIVFVALLALRFSAIAEDSQQDRGVEILAELVSQVWAADWEGAKLGPVRLVKQKPDLDQPTGLPPVWFAKIVGPKGEGGSGHLMWESSGEGRLVEFSLDAPLEIAGNKAAVVRGVPALQQFAIEEGEGGLVASGCVPTSAASVIAYWAKEKFPQWAGEEGKTMNALARRIRGRLDMVRFPDKDGFTEDGMALAGARSHKLAEAIRDDAAAHGVAIECKYGRFSMEKLKAEIEAGRPTLVSCVVRVPHKPDLSWAHQIAAVGWVELDGVELVGVLDNFFPTKCPDTVRWIRKDAFSSLITIRPPKAR